MALWIYEKYNADAAYSNFTNPHLSNTYYSEYETPVSGGSSSDVDPDLGYVITGSFTTPTDPFALGGGGVSELVFTYVEMHGALYYIKVDVYVLDYDTTYSKGSYIEDVIAEYGTYPDNGESGGYWYVAVEASFPAMKTEIGGVLKTMTGGKAKIGGALKNITGAKVDIGGTLKSL